MGALGAAEVLGQPAENDSKGCGTIMRVAPVAFLSAFMSPATPVDTPAPAPIQGRGCDVTPRVTLFP